MAMENFDSPPGAPGKPLEAAEQVDFLCRVNSSLKPPMLRNAAASQNMNEPAAHLRARLQAFQNTSMLRSGPLTSVT